MSVKETLARWTDALGQSGVSQFIGDIRWSLLLKRKVDPAFFRASHIFVVGCGHSGTSILLARLDNHSKVIAILGESRFFQLDAWRRSNLLIHWVDQWSLGIVLAEKTPIHIRYCSEIKNIFPNSRIVGICRDPLDVVASLYLRHNKDLDAAIDRWNRDNSLLVSESGNGLIDHIVKYENLVTDPESELRDVQMSCNLDIENGLSLSTIMKRNWYAKSDQFAVEDNKMNHDSKRQHQINQPIFDGRGAHKSVLSPAQIDFVSIQTSKVAKALDYRC